MYLIIVILVVVVVPVVVVVVDVVGDIHNSINRGQDKSWKKSLEIWKTFMVGPLSNNSGPVVHNLFFIISKFSHIKAE